MLEAALGYKFKYTELEPELRAGIRKLAEELRVLNEESVKLDEMVRGPEPMKRTEENEIN